MRRSPSRSRTDAALGLAFGLGAALAGCSDDDGNCGPGTAPADGITMTVGGETVTYGGFTASPNNDCRLANAPAGVISVTVEATQVGGTFPFVLCLPRPDLLGADAVSLTPSRPTPIETDRVMMVDSSASLSGGCTVAKDVTQMPSGTARFLGYCDGGKSTAGYAIELSGTVPLVRTCGGTMENVTGTITGTVAVTVE
ncbi:MAG TPA: hypothetical protein VM261_37050 [Kofleriaceae bacterium]|nr:hypothetical protein [Kofleriaceae bacterium]